MSSNLVLFGRVTRDPELKELGEKKTPYCKLGFVVNSGFGDKQKSVFMDVNVWGATATNVSKFLKKGSQALVEGELEQENWEKDGVKHNKIVARANKVTFVGSKAESTEETPETPTEDIPF